MANYVDKQIFLELLREHKKTKDSISYNKIGKIFLAIARNYLNKPRYINYSFDRKDEFVSDAVWTMCRYINKFDEEKHNNPFGYFSKITENSFKQTYKNNVKLKQYFINLSFIDSFDNDFNGDYE
jgi:hypothetical protein